MSIIWLLLTVAIQMGIKIFFKRILSSKVIYQNFHCSCLFWSYTDSEQRSLVNYQWQSIDQGSELANFAGSGFLCYAIISFSAHPAFQRPQLPERISFLHLHLPQPFLCLDVDPFSQCEELTGESSSALLGCEGGVKYPFAVSAFPSFPPIHWRPSPYRSTFSSPGNQPKT